METRVCFPGEYKKDSKHACVKYVFFCVSYETRFAKGMDACIFFITSLQLIHQSDACKHFRITEHQQVLAYETLDNMHVPAWQTEDNCLVLFLP